jgi:hypothetical protein
MNGEVTMMKVFLVDDAKKSLDNVLDTVDREGEAQIKKANGRLYEIRPVKQKCDTCNDDLAISEDEMLSILQEIKEN